MDFKGRESGHGSEQDPGGSDASDRWVAALNVLARGQEQLDAGLTQIAARQEAAAVVQEQRIERLLERLDTLPLPPDSREELIALREAVRAQSLKVEALVGLPGHRTDLPMVVAKSVAEGVGRTVRPAAQSMEDTASSLREDLRDLRALVASARSRKRQGWAVGLAAALALLMGFALYPLAATLLPGGSHLAALATGQTDRWKAGWALMDAYDLDLSDRLQTMQTLYNDNTALLGSCSRAVRTTGKPQRCEVIMGRALPAAVGAPADIQ
ncbi:DUF6118 family protein [Aureimonas sp. AU40]|uniref:DUF6118 family protein n=1 Tax=Aureimonas sp. AU40 TaxID=1637747 RepID=UPI0007818462|nr:DUF6118 family protein [Aureimonas sp. AU40]